jgi:hypothetical protein
MEEAPENGKESSHSANANGMIGIWKKTYNKMKFVCLQGFLKKDLFE